MVPVGTILLRSPMTDPNNLVNSLNAGKGIRASLDLLFAGRKLSGLEDLSIYHMAPRPHSPRTIIFSIQLYHIV